MASPKATLSHGSALNTHITPKSLTPHTLAPSILAYSLTRPLHIITPPKPHPSTDFYTPAFEVINNSNYTSQPKMWTGKRAQVFAPTYRPSLHP
ncbi:hypothetical protein BS50DRAFT_264837 [Corynespora cassiicola Philippines]|uniref:Uncharacterized protein n=1 Tax=Corynespora cassiicola Philippines TaxID=1448308 RepID=A0A2T2NYW1_CORCC|nr:hypothetical protein BS50DRAFT_264837 [Corynespora cassiicola Philippines]